MSICLSILHDTKVVSSPPPSPFSSSINQVCKVRTVTHNYMHVRHYECTCKKSIWGKDMNEIKKYFVKCTYNIENLTRKHIIIW
jgi:hypothetical protein